MLVAIAGVIVPAALAMIIGRDPWVRVAAAVVILGMLVGVMIAGGNAVVARYDAAPKAPDCAGLGAPVDPQIEAAFDELRHPGWVEVMGAGVTVCSAQVINLTAAEAIAFYRDQLVEAGRAIGGSADLEFVAHRGDLTLYIYDCGGGGEATIEMVSDGAPPQSC